MGVSTNAIICYGIMLDRDCPDYDELVGVFDYKDKLAGLIYKDLFQIVTHCSSEYPLYILAIAQTYSLAYRGYPVRVKLTNLDQNDLQIYYDTALFTELDRLGILLKSFDPGWLLCSYYG